jgi:hypothetical protein
MDNWLVNRKNVVKMQEAGSRYHQELTRLLERVRRAGSPEQQEQYPQPA